TPVPAVRVDAPFPRAYHPHAWTQQETHEYGLERRRPQARGPRDGIWNLAAGRGDGGRAIGSLLGEWKFWNSASPSRRDADGDARPRRAGRLQSLSRDDPRGNAPRKPRRLPRRRNQSR